MTHLSVEKLLPVVPAVASALLVIAAYYARVLIGALGRGFDQTKALKNVPAKDRLPALEVIENVLKIGAIETEMLTSIQRFKLIEKTIEERQAVAKRRFYLLIMSAAFMLILAVLWMVYAWNNDRKNDVVSSEIRSGNISRYVNDLADRGYYNIGDNRFVQKLADLTGYPASITKQAIIDFQKKVQCEGLSSKQCNEALADLRQRARAREAPFNEPGMLFNAGLSGGTQPRRFFINVTDEFAFKQSAVDVVNPLNGNRLRLWPRVAINTASRPMLVHLNEEQVLYLTGQKDIGLRVDRNHRC